ncbi:Aste57867_25062 [Aphanomyces stellatus]|uniref:Aste57867_25062 protein n=1 Tax=Aphanomyces stellatus TaxID=120398 RepID=A0A485LTH6_9STRA|nr:hypothetical protein As57867_024984 [Aphanomyces stellatus]VFU01693.1 Aste57867_25062 [Aphanomyces stellatus]
MQSPSPTSSTYMHASVAMESSTLRMHGTLPPLYCYLPPSTTSAANAKSPAMPTRGLWVTAPTATVGTLPSLSFLLNPVTPTYCVPNMTTATSPTVARATFSPLSVAASSSVDDEVDGFCLDDACHEPVKRRGYCKLHGSGRRCVVPGCSKGAQGSQYCIGHGGGKRCCVPDCKKSTQSRGLCKAHGGGVRCKFDGCNKSSQGGGFCRRHGGGKRCSVEGCPRGAQRGNTCAQHGGKTRCLVDDCVRADRGGGFCEVHRRDKVCREEHCNRLAKANYAGFCTQHHRERHWHAGVTSSPY